MTKDERRVHIEGMPPKATRPKCQRCTKALGYWTHDEYTESPSRIVKRTFVRWKGYPSGSTAPLFCTLTCALSFAMLAHEAGYRVQNAKKGPDR